MNGDQSSIAGLPGHVANRENLGRAGNAGCQIAKKLPEKLSGCSDWSDRGQQQTSDVAATPKILAKRSENLGTTELRQG
jgi:hypothetical protein